MKIQKGFTLLELLVTLTVVIVLAAYAVPALRNFIQNNKAVTETNLLVTAVNYARSEAVKRRMPVVVCALDSGDACSSSNIAWDSNGWMAFADKDDDGAYDAGEVLLKQWKDILNKNDIDITAGSPSVTFLPTGALADDTPADGVGLLVKVADTTQEDRCVRVLTTGRVEYEKMTDGVSCP
ncbi:MAG: GspH/FimT family pseudopilin [Gammaproteobacteria bacterium]